MNWGQFSMSVINSHTTSAGAATSWWIPIGPGMTGSLQW